MCLRLSCASDVYRDEWDAVAGKVLEYVRVTSNSKDCFAGHCKAICMYCTLHGIEKLCLIYQEERDSSL